MFKPLVITFVLALYGTSVQADIPVDSKVKLMFKIFMAGKNCLKTNPLSSKDIESFKNLTFPDGESANCFTACLFKRIGFMNDNGDYTPETALEYASRVLDNKEELQQIEEILQSCSYVNKVDVGEDDNGCERSALLRTCLKKKANEMGFGLSNE